jgi:serine/threonine protein kinase
VPLHAAVDHKMLRTDWVSTNSVFCRFVAIVVRTFMSLVQVMNRDDEETSVEVMALAKLQPHPNIVEVVGTAEYSCDSVFQILEFINKDLLTLIIETQSKRQQLALTQSQHAGYEVVGGLSEDVACGFFLQLVKAVRHCHRKHVYHGDISEFTYILRCCKCNAMNSFGIVRKIVILASAY